MEIDAKHFNFSAIDGYAKPFNFVVSPRRDGKSTAMILKAYKAYAQNKDCSIYLRRDKNDITDIYIQSLAGVLAKFGKPHEFRYKKTGKDEGFMKIYLGEETERPFLVLIALNQEKANFKSLFFPNVRYMVMDEFIIDVRQGEKYSDDEAGKFKELYETCNREAERPIQCYFLGNPYSLWNPYFVEFGVDPQKLPVGKYQVGKTWVAVRHVLNPALVEDIKKNNPLFDQFEGDAWAKYAIEGEAVNDSNVRLIDKPVDYAMETSIIVEGRFYAIWRYVGFGYPDPMYYVSREDKIGKRREIYAFDFKDLIAHSRLYSKEDKFYLSRFKRAIQRRSVGYQSLECAYTIEGLFASI